VLQTIEETSKNARTVFIAIIAACVYSWVAIATAPDAGLIANAESITLPIIGAEISVFGFFMVSPLILLRMFVYFHLYLQRLWEDFSHLPAIFPDGKRLDQKTYPWLLNGLVRRHFEKLRGGRTLTAHMEEIVTILVSWYMVPFTLFIFWFAYLRSQHVEGLISIGALLVASMMLANGFYRRAKQTLRTTEENPFSWMKSLKSTGMYKRMFYFCIATGLISYISINNVEVNKTIEATTGYSRALHLSAANLEGSNLEGIHLENAKGLTQEMLSKACGNQSTKLPQGLSIPNCK